MHRLILEFATAAALTLGAIVSLASEAIASDVMVSGAFARASAVSTAKTGAVYFTMMNHGAEPDRLVAAASDASASASLHQTSMENGVATMSEVPSLDLPPGGQVKLEPGGNHVMLMGLKSPLKQGDTIHLTLTFERAGDIVVEVPVGGVASTGEDHSAHTGESGN